MLKRIILIAIGIGLILVAGCSEQVTEPADNSNDGPAADFDGFTATAEQPGFGDEELLAGDETDANYFDPIANTFPMDSLMRDPNVMLFHFRAVWGRLRYDSSVTEVTNWTGRLNISRGGMKVGHVIKFEENDKLLPRTDRHFVDWVSHTTVHHDGIEVALFVPRPIPILDTTRANDGTIVIDTIWPEPIFVDFRTGPYSHRFSLREIAALGTVVRLDDGNAVAFHGMQAFRERCPRGFLTGQWGFDESGEGRFRGRWIDRDGEIIGHFYGNFGPGDGDRPKFVGKLITPKGDFVAFLHGTYGRLPDSDRPTLSDRCFDGWFAGEIVDADRKVMGFLGGRFGAAENVQGGFMQGRWKVRCDYTRNTDRDDIMPELDDGFGGSPGDL